MADHVLWPHHYTHLFQLALAETDGYRENAKEGNTVRELYPGDHAAAKARRQRAGSAFRSLELLGLVERVATVSGLGVWQTTCHGFETVFRCVR